MQTNTIRVEDLVEGPMPNFDKFNSMEKEVLAIREEKEVLQGRNDELEGELEKLKKSGEENLKALNEKIASLIEQIAELKKTEQQHNKLNVENLASQLPTNQLSSIKNLTSELQTMIDDEIEQLEQELQEAESSASRASKELEIVRNELVKEKKVAFETEAELRKELASCRKQVKQQGARG